MNGELWKLREDEPAPGISKTRRNVLVVVGLIGLLLICGGAGALVVRAKSARNTPDARNAPAARGPNEPRGLKLADMRVTFAAGVMQTVDLRLPCSGLLSIQLTFPKGTSLSVFLVPPEERGKLKAREICAHVDGFDDKTAAGSYQRAAQLPPGNYSLVLLDENKSRSVVQVNARLTDLR